MFDFLGKFSTDLAQLMTAGLGGLISIMLRREVRGVSNVMWGILGSAFCGKSVAWLCSGVGVNTDLTMFFVSVAGWIGANESMKFFERQIKSRLAQPNQVEVDQNGDK